MKLFVAVGCIAMMISCSSAPSVKLPDTTRTALLLPSPADSNSAEPFLFTDKNDVVYLSWMVKDSQTSTLKFSSWQNEKWTEPVVIASGNDWFVNWADYPV